MKCKAFETLCSTVSRTFFRLVSLPTKPRVFSRENPPEGVHWIIFPAELSGALRQDASHNQDVMTFLVWNPVTFITVTVTGWGGVLGGSSHDL